MFTRDSFDIVLESLVDSPSEATSGSTTSVNHDLSKGGAWRTMSSSQSHLEDEIRMGNGTDLSDDVNKLRKGQIGRHVSKKTKSVTKQRNANAAQRYRQRKLEEEVALKKRNRFIESEKVVLKRKIDLLKREIDQVSVYARDDLSQGYRLENDLLKEEVKRHRFFSTQVRSMFQSITARSTFVENMILAAKASRNMEQELLELLSHSMIEGLWGQVEQPAKAKGGVLSECEVECRIGEEKGFCIRMDVTRIPIAYSTFSQLVEALTDPNKFARAYSATLGSSCKTFHGLEIGFERLASTKDSAGETHDEEDTKAPSFTVVDAHGCLVARYRERLSENTNLKASMFDQDVFWMRSRTERYIPVSSFPKNAIAQAACNKFNEVLVGFMGVISAPESQRHHLVEQGMAMPDSCCTLEGFFITEGENGCSNLTLINKYASRDHLLERLHALAKKKFRKELEEHIILQYSSLHMKTVLEHLVMVAKSLNNRSLW